MKGKKIDREKRQDLERRRKRCIALKISDKGREEKMARRIENGKKIRRRREEKNREENTERAVVSHRWY